MTEYKIAEKRKVTGGRFNTLIGVCLVLEQLILQFGYRVLIDNIALPTTHYGNNGMRPDNPCIALLCQEVFIQQL